MPARKAFQRLNEVVQARQHHRVARLAHHEGIREVVDVLRGAGEMDELERALKGKDSWLLFINVDPRFNPIRGDPRFKDLLRRLGIPDAH